MQAVELPAPPGVHRRQLSGPDGPLTWREILTGWRTASFATGFSSLLANDTFQAFRWETPALTSSGLDDAFEFVTVDATELIRPADPHAFDEHFNPAEAVVTFATLGGRSTLIAPCPQAGASDFTHLAAFLRSASDEQSQALWAEVSTAMTEHLGPQPVWLSTAGDVVAWLHVRLDPRPKYYHYSPYRHTQPGS